MPADPVGRFAPSPSGAMHLGNARTALLAWLDVRARRGRMLMRIEDLDLDRCRPGFADGLRHDLEWLGLGWDAEVPAQSTREAAYDAAIAELRAGGRIFECYCTRRELREASAPHGASDETPRCAAGCRDLDEAGRQSLRAEGRSASLRVESPAPDPPVVDRLAGEVATGATSEVVVRRSDGLYAYHLAVVVDDAADGVTDVCRGDDLLAATGPQAGLQALLGLPRPAYAHVPLVLGPDGARLSKRHGAVAIADLRDAGIRPGEICGALARS
ncbi:MAG: tRNA glutamyl-Q(34) synthetase GluQRS, partial [Gaiellales bacterium]